MSLSIKIFQKELQDLQLEDIEAFFSTEQEETGLLEFKSGRVDLEGVYRSVCAFLNTEGGILILGAPTEMTSNSKKVCMGPLTPCILIKTQDVLMRSIASRVSPSPIGIHVKTLEMPSGPVFLLEIRQSVNPPHQVSGQGKYFIRLDREARPAPHGIVEALFFKRQKSDLLIDLGVTPTAQHNVITFDMTLKNDAMIHAEKANVIFEMYGVSAVFSQQVNNRDVSDGVYDNYALGIPPLIVKGMNSLVKTTVHTHFPFMGFLISYYAMDCKLQRLQGIFDLRTNKFVDIFNSRKDEDNKSSSPFEQYNNTVYGLIGEYFGLVAVTTGQKDIIYDDIASVQRKHLVSLPLSYIEFITRFGGVSLKHGDRKLNLYNVLQLEDYFSTTIEGYPIVTIGKLYNYPVTITFDFKGKTIFYWQRIHPTFRRLEGVNGDSFYQLLSEVFPEVQQINTNQNDLGS